MNAIQNVLERANFPKENHLYHSKPEAVTYHSNKATYEAAEGCSA